MKDVCNTNAKNDGVRLRQSGGAVPSPIAGNSQTSQSFSITDHDANSNSSFMQTSFSQGSQSSPTKEIMSRQRSARSQDTGQNTEDSYAASPTQSRTPVTPALVRKRPAVQINASPQDNSTSTDKPTNPKACFAYTIIFPDQSKMPLLTALEFSDWQMLTRTKLNLKTFQTTWYSFDNKHSRVVSYATEYAEMISKIKPNMNVWITADSWMNDPEDEPYESNVDEADSQPTVCYTTPPPNPQTFLDSLSQTKEAHS